MNVILISALFFFIFAIIGVNFMKGLMYYCETSAISNLTGFNDSFLDTKWDCLNYGGDWMPHDGLFDDVKKSLVLVFTMSQSFSWSIVMYQSTWIRDLDLVPRYYSTPYYSFYFVIFTIVGAFFITNLFVGVVVSTYNREKDKLGNYFLLTAE